MSRGVRTFLIVSGLVLAALGGAAGPVAAAPLTALPPMFQLSGDTARIASAPKVAVNPSGQAVVAWLEIPVDRPGLPRSTAAMTAFRSAAGVWSAPQRVSSTAYNATRLRVSIDTGGTATIAWTEAPDYYRDTVHVVRHTGAGFTGQQTFVPPVAGTNSLELAANQRGDAVLAWTDVALCDVCSRPDTDVWMATSAASGDFGAPQQVSDATKLYRSTPAASIGTQGELALTWQEGSTTDMHVRVRLAPSGQPLGSAVDIPVGSPANAAPSVAVTRGGGATITWWQARAMHASRLAADGSVASTQTLPGRYDDRFPQGRAALAADDAGRLTAAWVTNDGLWTAASSGPDGDLVGGTRLDEYATASDRSTPALAVDAAGGALLAWTSANALRAAWRPAGEAAFRAPGTIASDVNSSDDLAAALAGGNAALSAALGLQRDPRYVFATVGDPAAVAPGLPLPQDQPTPVPPADTSAPTLALTAAKVIKKRVKRRSGKRVTSRRVRAIVVASERTQLVATITKRVPGIRRGTSCVAVPKHTSNRKKAKRCTRTVAVGKPASVTVASGSTTLDLGPAPHKGRYRVTLTGQDAAGNAAAPVSRRLVVR